MLLVALSMGRRAEGSEVERFVTPGAKDLKAWIAEHGLSVPEFCTRYGLDRIEVQRILLGERLRISIDMGADISRVTGIPIERFGNTKAVRKLLLERWRKSHGRAA